MSSRVYYSILMALLVLMAGCGETANHNMVGNANNANSMGAVSNVNQNTGTTSPAVSGAEREFMMKAAQGGLAEVEFGQLASQRAANPAVKQFGQRMVNDHSKANDQLKQLALRKGVLIPAELDSEHKELMDKLAKLNGAAFDREYMKNMVEDHEKDVKEFQEQAEGAADPDLKAFASNTLPTLEQHLQMARDTAKKVSM